MPNVSIIMSNYNTPINYLREAIDSILSQSYKDFEFIIIDDCSTDDSLMFIKSYSDKRIKIIQNPENYGLTKSLNIGLNLSQGMYIARMDSDDVSEINRIEKQVKYMDDHPYVDVSCSWFRHFGSDESVFKKTIPKSEVFRCMLLFGNSYIAHSSVMFRRAFLQNYSLMYDEEIRKSQDYDMWSRCAQFGRFQTIPEILLNYRVHNKQISSYAKDEQKKCSDRIRTAQLNKMGIMPTSEELVIHGEMFDGMVFSSKHIEWQNRLIKQNDDKKTYNPVVFKSVIVNLRQKQALRALICSKTRFLSILSLLPIKERFPFCITVLETIILKIMNKRIDVYI